MSILFTASRLMKAGEVRELCQIAKRQPIILQHMEQQIKQHYQQYLKEKKEKAASTMLTA
jgi:hypothetical protein